MRATAAAVLTVKSHSGPNKRGCYRTMTYQSLYRALWALGLIGALLSPGLALAQDENDSALAECKAVSDPCKDANEILNSCEPFAPIFTCKGVNDVRLSFGETCAGRPVRATWRGHRDSPARVVARRW